MIKEVSPAGRFILNPAEKKWKGVGSDVLERFHAPEVCYLHKAQAICSNDSIVLRLARAWPKV